GGCAARFMKFGGPRRGVWRGEWAGGGGGPGADITRNRHVFVTDGSYPNGLAAVRSLSRAGFRVTVGERVGISTLRTIGFWSRYCAERFRYPDPKREPEACAAALAAHFRGHSYGAAIPVGL